MAVKAKEQQATAEAPAPEVCTASDSLSYYGMRWACVCMMSIKGDTMTAERYLSLHA